MFRPEDFAELLLRLRPIGLALRASPAAPNRRGTFSSWRVHPSSARGISSPMQDSSEFKISSCLNSGCVKYVDALTRRGMRPLRRVGNSFTRSDALG